MCNCKTFHRGQLVRFNGDCSKNWRVVGFVGCGTGRVRLLNIRNGRRTTAHYTTINNGCCCRSYCHGGRGFQRFYVGQRVTDGRRTYTVTGFQGHGTGVVYLRAVYSPRFDTRMHYSRLRAM